MRYTPALKALLVFAALLATPLNALTVAELTAIHDRRGEPYEVSNVPIDDAWRRTVGEGLRLRNADIAKEVMNATAGRFNGAQIHIFNQADTSLISYIAALEVDGEIVLLTWHSTAFFEIPELVERRIDLLDEVLHAFAPTRFPSGWSEATFNAAIQNMHAWAEGERSGRYPGWTYENSGGIQSLGNTVIPDWVEITVTSLDCAPRYPEQGWALQFLCSGG